MYKVKFDALSGLYLVMGNGCCEGQYDSKQDAVERASWCNQCL